jgi:hypothetical protein
MARGAPTGAGLIFGVVGRKLVLPASRTGAEATSGESSFNAVLAFDARLLEYSAQPTTEARTTTTTSEAKSRRRLAAGRTVCVAFAA